VVTKEPLKQWIFRTMDPDDAEAAYNIALCHAMDAYREKTANINQLALIDEALMTAFYLFIAMGNEPNALVPRGLKQALDKLRAGL
jgi:hypothetical protein